jgi:phenylacetate-CoA ligase
VRSKTQGGCEVSVQLVPSIERTARGKHRMLIQHLDLSDYLGAAVTPRREAQLLAHAGTP